MTSLIGAAQIVGSRDPYGSGPAVIDLAGAMIIAPSAPMLAGDTVSWTEQGSGAPDTVLATIRNTGGERYVAGPYAGASLKVPHLPASYDTYNVKADDRPRSLSRRSAAASTPCARAYSRARSHRWAAQRRLPSTRAPPATGLSEFVQRVQLSASSVRSPRRPTIASCQAARGPHRRTRDMAHRGRRRT